MRIENSGVTKKFLRLKRGNFFVGFVKMVIFDVDIFGEYVDITKSFFDVANSFWRKNFLKSVLDLRVKKYFLTICAARIII